MSLWTDREVKKLIVRMNDLEKLVHDSLGVHPVTSDELAAPPPEPSIDKRTKQYRETVGR